MTPAPPITVIGIGNPYRGDDAAGVEVLAQLRSRFHGEWRTRFVELDGEPVGVLQAWQGSTTVLIVDAVRSAQAPGTVHRLTAQAAARSAARGVALGGGHLLGLAEALDLARTLGKLPSHVEVIGIEGAHFELGQDLSPAVAAACESVARQLTAQLEALMDLHPSPSVQH